MWNKELLFVGTSWRGWGKLRFELSCVRKAAAERRVHKAEGIASARALRWTQTWGRDAGMGRAQGRRARVGI